MTLYIAYAFAMLMRCLAFKRFNKFKSNIFPVVISITWKKFLPMFILKKAIAMDICFFENFPKNGKISLNCLVFTKKSHNLNKPTTFSGHQKLMG